MKNILIPDNALELLKNDPIQNANILNFIADNPITDFRREGSSILVKGISDREWIYISSSDENEYAALLTRLPDNDLNFAVVEDWQIPFIQSKAACKIELTTIKYYLPVSIVLPQVNNSNLFPLSIEFAEYIYRNNIYKEFTSIEYIKERLTKGISCGILHDNKLIAWAITHDDGALGFLHVLDQYRGKGFAIEIVNFMVAKVREKNRIPFAQIEEHNTKSISLVKKLGFKDFKRVHWISKNR